MKGNIHHEGFIRKLSYPFYGQAKIIFAFIITGGKITHTSGIGNGGAESRFAEPHHSTADYRILDAKQFGNGGFYHFPLSHDRSHSVESFIDHTFQIKKRTLTGLRSTYNDDIPVVGTQAQA